MSRFLDRGIKRRRRRQRGRERNRRYGLLMDAINAVAKSAYALSSGFELANSADEINRIWGDHKRDRLRLAAVINSGGYSPEIISDINFTLDL